MGVDVEICLLQAFWRGVQSRKGVSALDFETNFTSGLGLWAV